MRAHTDIQVRDAESCDAARLAAIYNHYVRSTSITFEETEVPPYEMGLRITDTYTKNLPWLVAVHQGQVVGYAYASAWKARSAYRFAVEVTVYVAVENLHMGVGRRLYADLLANLRQKGTQTAIAGIALPNVESEALHRNFGFEKVAHFKRVGFKLGRWIDVAYWQLGWHDKISDEDCSGSNNYSDPSGTNGNPV